MNTNTGHVHDGTALPVLTDGKFFSLGPDKFYPKGVSYGPFKPDSDGSPFPSPEQVRKDFTIIRQLNANCLRVYFAPPRWFLDLAIENGLRVFVDFTWSKHTCFLEDRQSIEEIRRTTQKVARELAGHPGVFALTLANEISPDIARWYGPQRIGDFIDELADVVKNEDPQRLVTYANFPSTEFLQPNALDFISFNVYLHNAQPFTNYLNRLQSLSGSKPLVLSEFGLDSMREGEAAKSEILSGHIERVFRAGLAGAFIFTFTDDWHTGGHQIENWFFGLTDRERHPKASFDAVAKQFQIAPYFPLPRAPKVSVVVASYNGGRTLAACLDSLTHINYPDYEIILVDDGSTDETPKVAAHYTQVRKIRQQNMGLSIARNVGIAAATGEIVAFTDSDCRVDDDWLYYLVGDLLKTDACGIGGHNFPPPEDGWIAACVAGAPGGPAHVMLDDRIAEHIPGCNMAFWKWALDEIEGFDPIFVAAGDDVDVCWRLQQIGQKIAFSHAGFVWHYRRHTVRAYLKQQRGYGIAESLLQNKHPEYFNGLGGMRWRGRIYQNFGRQSLLGRFVIYHGIFATGLFQTLYTSEPTGFYSLLTSLEWHFIVTLGASLLAFLLPQLWPVPLLALLASVFTSYLMARRVALPAHQNKWLSRPLLLFLFFMQPLVRALPRYSRNLSTSRSGYYPQTQSESVHLPWSAWRNHGIAYWTETGVERIALLKNLIDLLEKERWPTLLDNGWDSHDVEVMSDRFSKIRMRTVCENHGGEKRLIRCDINVRWTALAKVYLATIFIYEFILLSVSWEHPLTRASIPLLPVFIFYLFVRGRRALGIGTHLLKSVAQILHLTELRQGRRAQDESTATS